MSTTIKFRPREIEVIRLIARGLTYEEIGQQLGISRRTAESYAEAARNRLGVKHARMLPAAYQEATGDNPLA